MNKEELQKIKDDILLGNVTILPSTVLELINELETVTKERNVLVLAIGLGVVGDCVDMKFEEILNRAKEAAKIFS